MRKHDLVGFSLLVLAAAGAIITFRVHELTGQIIYCCAALGMLFLPKTKGTTLIAGIGLLGAFASGFVLGDWMFSVVFTAAFLAINGRAFYFREDLYTKSLWLDPMLAVFAVAGYVAINLYTDHAWQGWALPAPYILISSIVTPILYKDKKSVGKLLENGLIETGTPAPDFSLENFDGKKVSLSSYKGLREVLLIFVRGDWCPGCHIMLRLYERERKKFQDKEIMLIAIGPDPAGVNKAMVEKLGLDFAVLSDDDMSVSKKYSLRIQEGVGESEYGIPLPASFLVDKQGVIRYTSRADNAGEFLSPEIIFDVLTKL